MINTLFRHETQLNDTITTITYKSCNRTTTLNHSRSAEKMSNTKTPLETAVRAKAKEIYLAQKAPRLDKIVERTGATKQQILEWKEEDGWLDAKRELAEREARELKSLKAESLKAMLETIITSRDILATIKAQVRFDRQGRRKATNDRLPLADVLRAWKDTCDGVLNVYSTLSRNSNGKSK